MLKQVGEIVNFVHNSTRIGSRKVEVFFKKRNLGSVSVETI